MKLFDQTESIFQFVSHYKPAIWCEPIQSCCHVPYWTNEQYEQLKAGDYSGLTWYEKEAVTAFFKQLNEQQQTL